MALGNILIVEDERIIARDIATQLKHLGYTVVGMVDSGADAIASAAATKPDLILMDIVLQGDIDGIEAAQQIQSQFGIPVVYLTAYADRHTLERAKITEPFGYILKPFNESALNSTIEMALGRAQAEAKIVRNLQIAEELRKRAEELSDLRSRYIAMTAHEFRNPLTTIQMSTELLYHYSDRLPLERKETHLKRIKSAIKHMTQLLEDTLILGQAEQGTITCQRSLFNLEKFCEEIVEEMKLGLPPDLHLQFVTDSQCQSACMDIKLLRHILTNLLSNAIKYSPKGGTVYLTIKCGQGMAIFHIKDEGIGIPEEDRNKLFTNFYRATNVGAIPGTGLGLSIVKRCVDVQGGNITVESQVGIGTTFTIKLPLM